MKMDSIVFRVTKWWLNSLALIAVAVALIAAPAYGKKDDKSAGGKASEAVQGAGEASAQFVQKLDESGVHNWSPDELAAWIIIGILIGSVFGTITSSGCSTFVRLGKFTLGLGGALVGGMVVRVGEIDLGWGEAVISYEELLFSFSAAVLFVVIAWAARAQAIKREKKK